MERLFVFLTTQSSNLTYGLIFSILIACGLGFPLPEDVPLIATGYLIWDGTMAWIPALSMTLLGVLIGDTILFFIGSRVGVHFLSTGKTPSFINPRKLRRTRAYFRKYGDKIVFFARFVAGFRAAAFFMAGAMKMRYRRFLWLDGLAAVLSVPVWIGVGYLLGYKFGEEISGILKSMKHLKHWVTGGTILIVVFVVFHSLRRYRNAKKNQLASRAPSRTT